MTNASSRKVCHVDAGLLGIEEINNSLNNVTSRWRYYPDNQTIGAEFEFDSYPQAVAFANAVAWIAMQQDHHPELKLSFRKCTVSYTTYTVNGVTVNDFICAEKIDALLKAR
ncbi:MAG: 4a-hydroxytetrahydrobiopterin dehydratase [Planctomycetota bacterium]